MSKILKRSDTPSKTYNQEIIEFWKEKGEKCLYPEVPESDREAKFTRDFYKKLVGDDSVIEMGCGDGRIAEAFTKEQYIGYDINPTVVKSARDKLPEHRLIVYSPFCQIPPSKWVFAHTMLLHVDDSDIKQMIKVMTRYSSHVVISEIMSRKFRPEYHRTRVPPVFNRNKPEYITLMKEQGFRVIKESAFFFRRYRANINYIVFSKGQDFSVFKTS